MILPVSGEAGPTARPLRSPDKHREHASRGDTLRRGEPDAAGSSVERAWYPPQVKSGVGPVGLLLCVTSCSLAFDVDGLRAGDDASSASSDAGPSASSASTSIASSTGSGDGGDGPTTSASTSASSGSGGDGGDASTSSAASTASAGGDGAGGSGGNVGIGGGGSGGGCSGVRWCDREGASADLCFDFDGAQPLAGLDVYDPDPVGVSTEVDVVQDPTLSCPNALRTRVLAASDSERAYAMVGPDLAADQGHHFIWEFSVMRIAVAEERPTTRTVAILSWEHLGAICQALIQMKDVGGAGGISAYAQGNDGSGWVGVGYASIAVDHPTIGEWTRVTFEIDTEAGQLRVAAGDSDEITDLDALCGPADAHYDIDVGPHYTDVEQENVYDDVTVRLVR